MTTPDRRKWLFGLFGFYCLVMLWLLILGRIGNGAGVGQVNLHPLHTVRRYLWVLRHSTDPGLRNNALANLLGNVGLFVPLGIFMPLLFAALCKFWRFLLLAMALILALELLQLVTGLGTLDVDDLILNLVGTVSGYLLQRLLWK